MSAFNYFVEKSKKIICKDSEVSGGEKKNITHSFTYIQIAPTGKSQFLVCTFLHQFNF